MEPNLNKYQENNSEAEKKIPQAGKKTDINRYENISADEISMKKLSFGLWWLKNRLKLKTLLIIFLIIASAASWGYTVFHLGHYLFFGMKEDEQMVRELAQSNIMDKENLEKIRAKNMLVSSVEILETNGKYDFYVKITNPNSKHWGDFDYCFSMSEKKIECKKGFIFPDESKYILALSKEFDRKPVGTSFTIKNIFWKRINLHQIPDWEEFKNSRLNINTSNVVFTNAAASELSEKLNLNTLNFVITNNTAFSYWEMPLTILLWGGNKIAGINEYAIKEFISNDEREIKITWPGVITDIKEIKITPNINIMDENVYLNFY